MPSFIKPFQKYPNLPNYPAYNTLEDTKAYLTNFTDKNYTLHMKATQIMADILLRLSDSALIPIDVTSLSSVMKEGRIYLKNYKSVFKVAGLENYTSKKIG